MFTILIIWITWPGWSWVAQVCIQHKISLGAMRHRVGIDQLKMRTSDGAVDENGHGAQWGKGRGWENGKVALT